MTDQRAATHWSICVDNPLRPLATRACIAQSLAARVVGLLGRDGLGEGEGLILPACRSIHTAFMRFTIDAVFVDRRWRVIRVWQALPPWRVTPIIWRAQAVIELPPGTVKRAKVSVGDQVIVEPVDGQNRLDTL